MKRWLVWAASAALGGALVVGAAVGYQRNRQTAEPEKAARAYFEAVASGNVENTKHQLTGNALTAFKRIVTATPVLPTGALTNLTTRWEVLGLEVAVADVVSEVQLVGRTAGAVDAQAARLSLTRTSEGWRIFQVEAIPLPYGGGSPVNTDAARALVERYITLTSQGKYEEALGLLAGRARTDAEASLSTLSQAKVMTEVTGLQLSIAQASSDALWMTATYSASVGGGQPRPVRLLFEVRQLEDRALIVRVNPVDGGGGG